MEMSYTSYKYIITTEKTIQAQSRKGFESTNDGADKIYGP